MISLTQVPQECPRQDGIGVKPGWLVFSPKDAITGLSCSAFATFRTAKYDTIIFHQDLVLVNAETGEMHKLLAPASAGNFICSSDGSMIAIFTQQHLSIAHPGLTSAAYDPA